MPRIPDNRQQISTSVPDAPSSYPGAALVGESIAQAGSQVAQTTNNLMNQIVQADQQDAAHKAITAYDLDTAKKKLEIERDNPDGYAVDAKTGLYEKDENGSPKTNVQVLNEYIKERIKTDSEALPGGIARRIYSTHTETAAANQQLEAEAKFFNTRADYYNNRLRNDTQAQTNELLKNPTMAGLTAIIDRAQARTKYFENMNGVENTAKLQNSLMKDNLPSYFRSRFNQSFAASKGGQETGIDQVIKEIQGTDKVSKSRAATGLPVAANLLEPDTRQTLLHEALALKNTARQKDLSAIEQQTKDYLAMASQGLAPLGSGDAVINAQASTVATGQKQVVEVLPNIFKVFAANRMAAIAPQNTGSAFGTTDPAKVHEAYNTAAEKAIQDAKEFAEKRGWKIPPNMAGEAFVAAKVEAETKIKAFDKTRTEDQAEFFKTYDPAARLAWQGVDMANPESFKSTEVRVRVQKAMNDHELWAKATGQLGAYQPVSKETVKSFAETLKGIKDATSAEEYVSDVQKFLGPNFAPAVRIGVQENFLGQEYMALTIPLSDRATRILVNGIKTPRDEEKEKINGWGNTNLDSIGNIPGIQRFTEAIDNSTGRNFDAQKAHKELRGLLYKIASANPVQVDKGVMGKVEALTRTYKDLIGKEYSVVDVPTPNSHLLIVDANNSEEDKKAIPMGFARLFNHTSHMTELDVQLPPGTVKNGMVSILDYGFAVNNGKDKDGVETFGLRYASPLSPNEKIDLRNSKGEKIVVTKEMLRKWAQTEEARSLPFFAGMPLRADKFIREQAAAASARIQKGQDSRMQEIGIKK